jgi:hypothetical protein
MYIESKPFRFVCASLMQISCFTNYIYHLSFTQEKHLRDLPTKHTKGTKNNTKIFF